MILFHASLKSKSVSNFETMSNQQSEDIQCNCVRQAEEDVMNTHVTQEFNNLNEAVEYLFKPNKCSSAGGCDKKRRLRLNVD